MVRRTQGFYSECLNSYYHFNILKRICAVRKVYVIHEISSVTNPKQSSTGTDLQAWYGQSQIFHIQLCFGDRGPQYANGMQKDVVPERKFKNTFFLFFGQCFLVTCQINKWDG